MFPFHFLRKNPDEKQQEEVADIDVRRQDKEKVAEDAARHQSQHVENGSRRGELAEQGFLSTARATMRNSQMLSRNSERMKGTSKGDRVFSKNAPKCRAQSPALFRTPWR